MAFQRVPGTIRLFERKEYYSAHGQDALYGTWFHTPNIHGSLEKITYIAI